MELLSDNLLAPLIYQFINRFVGEDQPVVKSTQIQLWPVLLTDPSKFEFLVFRH